jgi:hypothetical protein
MGDLRPLGSERLQGTDKLKRIMEIATYGQQTESTKEYKSADYSIQLADGNYYGIVKEKSGYIVKKGINESEFDYIEPMKNRKYHKSFSQAMKKINLLAGELNRVHEHVENISLIGEQKKFVLKTPKSEEPSPEEPAIDDEMDLDMGDDELDLDMGDDELDLDMGDDESDSDSDMSGDELDLDMGDDESEGSGIDGIKIIQKLTGKLAQKLRTMDQKQGLGSSDIKYVLNSIISAIDLIKLNEEDREDILSKFESDDIIDYGVDDEAELDIEAGDDLDFDLDIEDEESIDGEIGEHFFYYDGDIDDIPNEDEFLGQRRGDNEEWLTQDDIPYTGEFDFDYDEDEFDDYDAFTKRVPNQKWFQGSKGKDMFDTYREKYGPLKYRRRRKTGWDTREKSIDEIFSESKIDKVLNRYFKESATEKTINENKKVESFLKNKIKNISIKKEIKNLSESIEQELACDFLINENNTINLLGKTNLKNILFEIDQVKYKVTPKGEII